MLKTIKQILFFSLTAIVLNSIVYYGFVTNYTRNLFSEHNFEQQYGEQVYKSRLLGASLVLRVYKFLEKKYPEKEDVDESSLLKKLDPNSSRNFYLAYYIVNTSFLVLCSILLVFLFEQSCLMVLEKEKILTHLLLLSMICITQFVVVPYDLISYFFILLSIWAFSLHLKKNLFSTFLLFGVILCVSTFNREISALSLSFFATVSVCRNGFSRSFFINTGILALFFLIPYCGLHWYFKNEVSSFDNFAHLRNNFQVKTNYLGILFWLILGYISIVLANSRLNRKAIFIFHLFCIPYIIICFIAGVLFEMRLYIPLFITSIFIGNFQPHLLSRNSQSVTWI